MEDLAHALGLSYAGDGEKLVQDVNTLSAATADDLSFLDNIKYASQLETTKAGVVVLSSKHESKVPVGCTAIYSEMPYADYAKILNLFYPVESAGVVHATAVVEPSASIGQNVSIGAGAYIGEGVVIGDNSIIEANVTITCAHIGHNTIIHSGAVIGGDGFGFAYDGKMVHKVPQIGMVKIGNFVEIGSCTTVDRGSLEDTIIEDYVKIDNLVQIAHNVKVGMGSQIVSQTGVAGSTKIGQGVIIGGQCGIVGHIEMADGVMIAARSGVTKTLTKKGTYAGFPAVEFKQWKKLQAVLSRLVKSKEK